MSLLDIRKEVVKVSGRYDLIVDTMDYVDNGINSFIIQGQRMLDRKVDFGFGQGKYFVDIEEGDYLIKLTNCRAINEVWIANSDGRSQVIKMPEKELRGTSGPFETSWLTAPFSSMEKSTPNYYYPTTLRRIPENGSVTLDSATLTSYLDTLAPFDGTFNGLILLPPADGDYVLEISGLFYTNLLVEDADENYWSINYPNLLIMAAVQQLSKMYGGVKSVANWDNHIDSELIDVEKDFISQSITDIDQMEG
jgi:hypothetical protein